MEFLESKNSSRHMIIEVMEKKLKFCGTKKYVRTSSTRIHKTIKINDQGIGKLTLKLSPYVSSLLINVSVEFLINHIDNFLFYNFFLFDVQ